MARRPDQSRQHDHAICLRHWEWSETSQTVVLFARSAGLVRALAKGSRRDRSPFSGGLELATLGEILLIPKPAGQLAILASWDLADPFSGIRRSLPAFRVACALCDAIAHTLGEGDPHPEVFEAVVAALGSLSSDKPATTTGLWAIWRVLCEAGYRVELNADVVTGERLGLDRPALAFRPASGGFTIPGEDAGSDPWLVRSATIAALRQVDRSPDPVGCDVAADVASRGIRLLSAFLTEVLGRPVPALASLADSVAG